MKLLLQIKDLKVEFPHGREVVRALEGVDLDIYEGEVLVLAGESGSGKSLTALSVTKLLPENARITGGEIIFQGQDLLKLKENELEAIRGRDISYIFQEAAASLNPVLTIGSQITESIILHQKKTKKEAEALALELLQSVRLAHPRQILRAYPHQLSGGMNQRVMIAIALCSRPRLLIADEPTTALDVTIEKEIIRLLLELKQRFNFSILFITHNLALAEKLAGRIAIMYQGRIVEKTHPHALELAAAVIR